jgi:hypothetical protein
MKMSCPPPAGARRFAAPRRLPLPNRSLRLLREGSVVAALGLLSGCQTTRAAQQTASASASDPSPRNEAPVESAASASATPVASAAAIPAVAASKIVHMAFVGDVSLSLNVREYLDGKMKADPPIDADYPFHFVSEKLRAYDVLVGNLECVASEKGSRTRKFPLQCSMKTADLLKDAGFDVLSVANNHQLDMGTTAYDDEVPRLRAAGFKITGDYLGSPPRDAVLVDEVEGVRIGIVGIYNRHKDEAVADVKRARKESDIVIAFLHWGDDFHSRVAASQRELGHDVIDAGADAIVGAHAHVVQPEETYKGKLIAYGLGNFVFTGMNKPGTHNGALIELDVDIAKKAIVDHRYRKLNVDEQGIPRFVGDDATTEPFVDPPLSAPQNEPVPVPAQL